MRTRVGGLAAAACLAVLAACSAPVLPVVTPTPSPAAAVASSTASTGAPSTSPTASPLRVKTWVEEENARRGDTRMRIAVPASGTELAGYADRVSVLPGERLGLHLTSSLGPVSLSVSRIGWYAGKRSRTVWRARHALRVRPQAPATVAPGNMVSVRWPRTTRLDTTGWPEGTYVAVLRAGGKGAWVPFTIRSAEPTGRLVLVNAVATWQAYNQWGGWSLYKGPDGTFATRATRVSFDRPYDGRGADLLMRHEARAIELAERLGLDLAYTTSWDLDRDPAAVTGAAGVVSLGHDEYWSVRMREHVEAARDAGTNLAFLGANAVYWRVRFATASTGPGRIVVGFKEARLDPVQGPTTTDLWRRAPDARPESSLTGMLYECFPARGALVIVDPGFFLLKGTGAKRGSSYPGLVGIEIDRAYPLPGTPRHLEVVAHSPVLCSQIAWTHSDLTYYTVASGAGVVATGSMAFTRGLRGPRLVDGITPESSVFARRFVSNLLRAMAKGPMGTAHPSRSNTARLGLNPSTRTGTGNAVDAD